MAIAVQKKTSRTAPKEQAASLTTSPSLGMGLRDFIISRFKRGVSSRDKMFLISQLSLMLEVGMSLRAALQTIGEQAKNPALKPVIQAMVEDIEVGRQLSDAMNRHPWVFDSVCVSMVKAGETGGFLKGIIDRIVEMEEKRQALIAQIRSALTYPAFLCVLGVLVVAFVLVAVLPKFTMFFEGKEDILPLTTRFLMALSASLRGYWWVYVGGAAGLVAGIKWLKDSGPGQAFVDRVFVSGPVLGKLFTKIFTCRLLRTLGHLLESQVSLLDALEVTRATLRNRYFVYLVADIRSHVEQGGKFSQAFAKCPYIMETIKDMVAIGEEAGKLSPVLLRLAEFYDGEVDQEIKALSVAIEPLALIVMGGMVGLIVSSVILPLFKLAQALH